MDPNQQPVQPQQPQQPQQPFNPAPVPPQQPQSQFAPPAAPAPQVFAPQQPQAPAPMPQAAPAAPVYAPQPGVPAQPMMSVPQTPAYPSASTATASGGKFSIAGLPKGVLVVAGLQVLGLVVTLLNHKYYSSTYLPTIFAILDFVAAVGLLMRFSMARKVMLVLMALTIVLDIYYVVKLTQAKHQLDKITTTLSASYPTTGGGDATNPYIKDSLDKVNAAVTKAYVILGISIVEAGATLYYLNRPNVKAAINK